jgi:2-phosphoglycerate kinase
MKKKNYSQYDLMKVKVSLQDHFYVFSRFLMSRILTLIRVNEKDAVKITLDIKKYFVEMNKVEVTQMELEQVLFEKLNEFKYGSRFVQRYQLVTRFYQKRIPFVIIVCGTECMGKSTLVTQLAERVNISNIL